MNSPSFFLTAQRYSLTILVAIALASSLFGQSGKDFRPPQDVDGVRAAAPGPGQFQSPQDQKSGISTQKAFDLLVKELDNLIPGDLVDGSDQKKAVEEAVTAFQLRDAKRVMEIFNAQSVVDPEFPPTDLLLAGLSFAVQDPKSGRALLERAGATHPDSPSVYSTFTRLAINEGRVVDALALLEKMARVMDAGSLSEKSKEFYQAQYFDGMADVAMRQERHADARTFLAQQLALLPNNPKALMVSAELEFKEKNLEASLEYLNKLRSVLAKTRVPETIIASWFQRSGQPEEAKKWIASAANKYTDNPQVQLEVASWAVNEEDFPSASASIKKAESTGETPLSKTLKAKIAFARESYGVAESHYKELFLEQPENFDAANMYALSLIESSDPDKRQLALDVANRNFRTLPDNVVAQAALGYIRLRLGDVEQAKSALGRALQSNASSPEIRFFGASLLREMKQVDNAKTVLEQALAHKGIFLYRSKAQKMLNELSGGLPAPRTDK